MLNMELKEHSLILVFCLTKMRRENMFISIYDKNFVLFGELLLVDHPKKKESFYFFAYNKKFYHGINILC